MISRTVIVAASARFTGRQKIFARKDVVGWVVGHHRVVGCSPRSDRNADARSPIHRSTFTERQLRDHGGNCRRMDRIGGQAWTIRMLFGRRFVIDHYQREYQWEKSHLQDLINDLTTRYLAQRRPEHELRDVATFEPYF